MPPTWKHSLSAIIDVTLEQTRVLAVAQLDRWAETINQRLRDEAPASADSSLILSKPLIIGALAGIVVVLLVTDPDTNA